MGQQRAQVGFAVVGLGPLAQSAVLPAFAEVATAQLVAVVSGDAQKRAAVSARYGVPAFDYEQLEACLALPEVEAVYVATPNALHADACLRAARAGVHVLCEKPMATSSAECRAMLEACAQHGARLMVAYRLHFEPAHRQALEAVHRGEVGEPRLFSATFGRRRSPDSQPPTPKLGGGVWWDVGIYCVNAARALFQAEPVQAVAFSTPQRDARAGLAEAQVSALLRFPGDRLASFSVSFEADGGAEYRLVGTRGQLEVTSAHEPSSALTWRLTAESGRTLTRHDPAGPRPDPVLSSFCRCLLEGLEPEPSGWEGLRDVQVLEALQQSLREGKVVTVTPSRGPRPLPSSPASQRLAEEPRPLIHPQTPF